MDIKRILKEWNENLSEHNTFKFKNASKWYVCNFCFQIPVDKLRLLSIIVKLFGGRFYYVVKLFKNRFKKYVSE